MSSSQIAVYSLPDLKNTTDDALPNYLTSLKFEQSHFLTDVRLALGYSAVIIAAITFYFDYTLGWDETKGYTFWAVIAYFILNGALTLWIWFAEKGKIFNGSLGGTTISIASSVTKHTPIYKLTVRYSEAGKNEAFDWETLGIEAPFTRWFTADGQFIAKPFQQWLASTVPVIGQADSASTGKKGVPQVAESGAASTSDLGRSPAASTRSRKAR
ncbi:hypothetical protein MMC30_003389 [Trapelia coarctata]|nr:hypothetical protein [Trapelia coarctata]